MIHRATHSLLRYLLPMAGQRLSILIYHRVLAEPDTLRPGDPDALTFRRQMEAIGRIFNMLPLGEAVSRCYEGTLPLRAAAVTFDDGYADNATIAMPVLREMGIPATIFVATGFLNGGRMFNDSVIEAVRCLPDDRFDLDVLELDGLAGCRLLQSSNDRLSLIRELLPYLKYADPASRDAMTRRLLAHVPTKLRDDLMMTDAQVRALAREGVGIGAHTVTHPILARLDDEDAEREIVESKSVLEKITGAEITLFAYPNGRVGDDYIETHVGLVREAGFQAAVSTHPGTAGPESDPYQLPRFTPWDRTPLRFVMRMGMNAAGLIR